jgi:cytidyltransferase-like protein
MKIGIFGGAFKPLTKGHFTVIKKAAKENDEVYLYVSTNDRHRQGEFPLSWDVMRIAWIYYYQDIIPKNVLIR